MCVLFRCVCITVCIARHLCVWIVDHVAHAIILYLERMCRVSLLELSDKILYNIKGEVHKPHSKQPSCL